MKQMPPFVMLAVILVAPARAERNVIVIEADQLAPPELRADEPARCLAYAVSEVSRQRGSTRAQDKGESA